MEVGVRELKAKLSEYVRLAAAGEHVVVTDRGRPVAALVAANSNASRIDQGIEEGWIEAPRRRSLTTPVLHASTESTRDVLDRDRG